MDFEVAAIAAVRNVFGTGIQIRGCFYHLCQCVYRKIQDLGLTTLYKEDENFSNFAHEGTINGGDRTNNVRAGTIDFPTL